MRETPTSRVYAQEPSEWCGPSQHIVLVQRGWKARKIPAMGRMFFLTFPFIERVDAPARAVLLLRVRSALAGRHGPRSLALSGRKALLRKLLPRKAHAVRYVEHVASGTDLFRVICDRDMEGIVAKQASARYTPEATTWVKIKNREYSQAVGREDFFDRRKAQNCRLQSRP